MADISLLPRTACDAARVQIGPWSLQELPARACVSVIARRGQIEAVAQDMQNRAGGEAVSLGDVVTAGACQVFRITHGQWFVQDDHQNLMEDLRLGLGATASLTDQSDAWAAFALKGPSVTAVLERCAMMELSRLTDGHLQRGLLEHMNVFLLCHQHGQNYEIMVSRSYAQSLQHAVSTAMASAATLVASRKPISSPK